MPVPVKGVEELLQLCRPTSPGSEAACVLNAMLNTLWPVGLEAGWEVYSVAADAAEECGDVDMCSALRAACSTTVADFEVLRDLLYMRSAPLNLAEAVRLTIEFMGRDEVWSRADLRRRKPCHASRAAGAEFALHPLVLYVVVSRKPPTKCGFRTRAGTTPIRYYRKSGTYHGVARHFIWPRALPLP